MIPGSPTIDAFLNTVVSRLYVRAQANGRPAADAGMMIVDDPAMVDDNALMTFFDRVRPILKQAQYLTWAGANAVERSRLAEQGAGAIREFAAEVERSPDLANLMNRFRQEADSITGFSPHEELLMN